MKSESEVTQSYLTLRELMGCSPPGSSVHGIFQAKVLEWGAIAFSKVALCCIKFIVRDSFQAHKYLMNLYHRDSRIVILNVSLPSNLIVLWEFLCT